MEVGEVVKSSTFQWKINTRGFDKKDVGDHLLSPIFYSENSDRSKNKWQLKLYPRGWCYTLKDYSSLFLINLNKSNITASYAFLLLDQDNVKVDCTIFKEENKLFNQTIGRGCLKFVEHRFIDENKKLLKDNYLTISCEIVTNKKVVENSEPKIKNSKLSKRLKFLDDFEYLLSNDELSDVTVTADGKSFKLHKCILSLRSSVFQAMFKNDMTEKITNSVKIEDVKYEVLDTMFRYIYTGKVDNFEKIIGDVLIAAEKYNITGLKQLCEETMSDNLSKDNSIEYLHLATMNNAGKLKEDSIKFISLHIEDFILKSEFRKLGMQHPEVLLKIIEKQII